MVYNPQQLPEPKATAARWRSIMSAKGLGDPFLVAAQAAVNSRTYTDPREYGFDAAAEFPPHKVGFTLPINKESYPLFDPKFRGSVRRYRDMRDYACSLDPTPYKLFRGVCPNWDNEARKPNRGFTFVGSTPRLYGDWLQSACAYALRDPEPDARIVFINAWNEWGEGAYLEPDRHFGHAYLVETARVLRRLGTGEGVTSAGLDVAAGATYERGGARALVAQVRTKSIGLVRTLAERLARPPDQQ
jgi:hypothetical protein